MSKTESPITDELVLAAVDRAERHSTKPERGVPEWTIFEHLHVRKRTAQAREVRVRLNALESEGSIERARRHGLAVHALTAAGAKRLSDARAEGLAPALPDSPQRRAWRSARSAAAREIERFASELRDALADASGLLEADPPAGSDAWLETAERLGFQCRRLASASYCLREWQEPDDERADVDEHTDPADERLPENEQLRRRARRTGRRNTRLWT
ncbi:MAG TPA: hypothetical protein VGY13_06865 [Solirubrobacteraceae bacterium]|jgi:hypothetical protein|nr:hypothetical protein [Solirubrobacteraceae bacterium]